MRSVLSGLVLLTLLGCYRGGVDVPGPRSARADSTAWRRLLAPAIADYLRREPSYSVPSQIIAREGSSRWTNRLVIDVHALLMRDLEGLSVDRQRTLEIRDPVPVTAPSWPGRRALIEVPIDDAHCTATADSWQGAYYGAI